LIKKYSVGYKNAVFLKHFFHVIVMFITLNPTHQCHRSWPDTFQSFVTCNLRRPEPNIQESFIPSGPHEESLYCPHFCPPVHHLCPPEHHSLSCACNTLGFAYPALQTFLNSLCELIPKEKQNILRCHITPTTFTVV
jgi:hypothetical protein